ncbi:MAG: hypothetical protein ACXWUG_09155 [Polyangiales bacterium]
MPTGSQPPVGILTQSVFNAVNALGYSSTYKSFLDGSNNPIYLFIERQSTTSELAQWNYGTATEAGINPRGEIASSVAAIINNGSYNTADSTVSYAGKKYKFRIERDANGVDQVKAVQV